MPGEEESKTQHYLDEALHMKDQFLRNKMNYNFFKGGDKNKNISHSMIKLSHAKSNISRLKHVQAYLEEDSENKNHVIN